MKKVEIRGGERRGEIFSEMERESMSVQETEKLLFEISKGPRKGKWSCIFAIFLLCGFLRSKDIDIKLKKKKKHFIISDHS